MVNLIIIGCVVGLVVVIIMALVYWYRHQCLLRERAQIMRDANRHRDFSFRLPTRGLFFGEKALQEALNDMGQEIQKLVASSEVESWQKLTRVLTHEIMNATTPIQSISQAYLKRPDIKGSPYEEGIRAINDTSTGLMAFEEGLCPSNRFPLSRFALEHRNPCRPYSSSRREHASPSPHQHCEERHRS